MSHTRTFTVLISLDSVGRGPLSNESIISWLSTSMYTSWPTCVEGQLRISLREGGGE